MEFYSLLLSRSTRELNYIYIYNARLQAELIGGSSIQIGSKMAKLLYVWVAQTEHSLEFINSTCSRSL